MKNRFGLSIIAITLMLMGLVLAPVSAAFVPVTNEMTEQSFDADDNGHTYVYVDGNLDWLSDNYLVHDEDVDITSYSYESSYWSRSTPSYDGPATRDFSFVPWNYFNKGWLDDETLLPRFIDIANTTNDLTVGAESKRGVFPLSITEPNSVIINPESSMYGTFNLTDEEFVHMTIASRQDTTYLEGYIANDQGVIFAEFDLEGGDVQVVPFRPDGPGMYFLYFILYSDTNNLCVLDISFESITPILLPLDSLTQGVLPGSEYAVQNENGDLIHTETAPTAITYKFHSNSSSPERIRYSLNLPPLDNDVYEPFNPYIFVTSDCYDTGMYTSRYMDYLYVDSGPFFFKSFQDEYYYMTVIGMENVEFNLYHDSPMAPPLPINQEFFIENYESEVTHDVFSLLLSQDSVLRVNSTSAVNYDWDLWTVDDDMIYRYTPINHHSSLTNAQFYYIPAGDYIVMATADSSTAQGHYEFNLGPVIDGLGAVSVDNGGLVGVRFDTNALDWLNVSWALNTHDNITVDTDFHIFNMYGGQVGTADTVLGNRQSGLGWVGYPLNYSSLIYNTFTDGFGIVAISPYNVENNTAGLPGNVRNDYSLDYTIAVEDAGSQFFNDTAVIDMANSWHNFTLGDPGDSSEAYFLTFDCEAGLWMNVSVTVEDVVDWNCAIYQEIDGKMQYLSWGYLDDTFSGSYTTNATFQFGSISDNVAMAFWVDRALGGEGRLDIAIDPHVTNSFERMVPVTFTGTGPAAAPPVDMGLAVAGVGIAAVAIVVVVVVILKKKGR